MEPIIAENQQRLEGRSFGRWKLVRVRNADSCHYRAAEKSSYESMSKQFLSQTLS
jgi:hypothetical protein